MGPEDVKESLEHFFGREKHDETKMRQLFEIFQAGFQRINEKEELANDIPEIFTRISCTKTGMQFYLSAVMEIAFTILKELDDRSMTCTEKNLKSLPFVLFILKSKEACMKSRGC
jgi:hypothetical protein